MNIHAGWTREICRAGIQFRGVGRPITKAERASIWIGAPTCHLSDPWDLWECFGNRALSPYRTGLEGPSCYRVSVPSAAPCAQARKTITSSKRYFWVLPSLNGTGEVQWQCRPPRVHSVPEPQQISESQRHLVWAGPAKPASLKYYVSSRPATLG